MTTSLRVTQVLQRRLWALVAGLLAFFATRAQAQSCHSLPVSGHPDAPFRLSATGVFASYQNPMYTGEYQGLRATAAFMHPWLQAEASLPYYRLVRNGLAQRGLGDVGANLRGAAYRTADGRFSLGPALAATLPSGDANRDLGMGHVMLMPGGWFRMEEARFAFWSELTYGHSVGPQRGGGMHHHGSVGPIVNPMNMAEVEHSLGLAYWVHQRLRVVSRLYGAVPAGAKGGAAREIAALGLQGVIGPFDAALDVELPLVGSPFQSRTLLTLGAQW